MSTSELDSRNIAISMRKSVENLVISSQDAIGQSISQALSFSGVISQHTSQILHETTRTVSRSPSPALRSHAENPQAESAAEADYAEAQSASCGEGGGSVGGGGDVVSQLVVRHVEKVGEIVSTPTPAKRSDSGSGRAKKKSWYSALYPTYKSRSDDFKRLFKDLPDDERLIVDYSCALQKDILAQGRLYASQNYLCFYANIFGWETNVTLRWKDITGITKEKTALVIPNAIQVCTETERHFLASFSGRDKAYLMLFRVWQNALMDQPRSSQEIWQWVHSCYGSELGFNSEDEGYARDLDDDKPLSAMHHEDLAETSSMETGGGESREDVRGGRGHDHIMPPVSNGNAEYRGDDMGDALPTDMSDTSDSEPDKPNNSSNCEKCECTDPHEGRLLLQTEVAINIDQLFTLLFTSSKMYLELMAARNARDFVQHVAWQDKPDTGLKCRQIYYVLALQSGPLAPKEVCVTETQVMNKCTKPGVLYSINITSDNTGIPYADHFSVETHYCLQRVSESTTAISLYTEIKYRKNVMGLIRGFLEKNTFAGLEEYAKLLESTLQAEAGGAASKKKGRRRRRANSSPMRASLPAHQVRGVVRSAPAAPPSAGFPWLPAILVLLVAINGLLCWMCFHREPTDGVAFDMAYLQERMSVLSGVDAGAGGADGWSAQLRRAAARQRAQLRQWRAALQHAVAQILQTEESLAKLLETIKPSLDEAQSDASESHTHPDL